MWRGGELPKHQKLNKKINKQTKTKILTQSKFYHNWPGMVGFWNRLKCPKHL